MESGAVFSPCRTWRYTLTRVWDPALPMFVCIGLNPSTADEIENDPTITREIGFAQREGCGGLVKVNLFAFRATDPKDMKKAADPIGPDNDHHIELVTRDARRILCGWGNHGRFLNRDWKVAKRLQAIGRELLCLKRNKGGEPQHPLYVKADTPLIPFSV